MLSNLKKVEKSLKELNEVSVSNDLINRMVAALSVERLELYKKPEVLLSILKKDKACRGLNTPKELKKAKVINEGAIPYGFVKMSDVCSFNYDMKMQMIDSFGSMLVDTDLNVRLPLMKKFIVKNLIQNALKRKALMDDNKITITLSFYDDRLSYDFNLDMLESEEKETILDIVENFDAYEIHPDVGKNVMEKEIEKVLEKYYNTYVFYLKDDEGKTIEFKL